MRSELRAWNVKDVSGREFVLYAANARHAHELAVLAGLSPAEWSDAGYFDYGLGQFVEDPRPPTYRVARPPPPAGIAIAIRQVNGKPNGRRVP